MPFIGSAVPMTAAQRDAVSAPSSGTVIFNSTKQDPQVYRDGVWQNIGAPTGTVYAFAGATSPAGWLLCDGSAVSRATYSDLFAVIGTSYGTGDGTTTFNLPDYRWTFLRGRGPNLTVTGGGSANYYGGDAAQFMGHQFNRNGIRVRMISGSLGGLALNADYYVILDPDTPEALGFATTKQNALDRVKIFLSGVNSAVIQQWEDTGADSRGASASGGNSGDAVGSYQADEFKSHTHSYQDWPFVSQGDDGSARYGEVSKTRSTYTTGATGGRETRPTNISVNYIIKV